MNKRFWRKRVIWGSLAALVLGAGFIVVANCVVLARNRARLFADVETVPFRDVGVVLGASPVTSSGKANLHFVSRIEGAAALYHAGKVRHLLVSGDNHRADYDEPTAMKNALIARGIPAEAITCDYAGFRTLDSMVRAKSVFGLTGCTIISQRYHNSRALEIARAQELDAVAFCSRDVPALHALRTEIREMGARAMTLLDLYVWHRQAHFSGPYEPIQIARRG